MCNIDIESAKHIFFDSYISSNINTLLDNYMGNSTISSTIKWC